MVETAIYVLLGALTTALVALIALPAVSRRAVRLAQGRARLTAPLSAAEAMADRDALRGRHAVELALAERRADIAQDRWAAAQIELGQRAAEIVRRDLELKDKAQEIARQREELAALARDLTGRDVEIAARELALRDFESQRDAAAQRLAEMTAQLAQSRSEAEQSREMLESQIDELSKELSVTQRRTDGALFAARLKVEDSERRLQESEAVAARLRRQFAELTERLEALADRKTAEAEGPRELAGDKEPASGVIAQYHDQLTDSAVRVNELTVRLGAIVAAQVEAEASVRAARAERDLALRESERARELAQASVARAEALSDADASLRQEIAALGRELVQGRLGASPPVAPIDAVRETAS